MWMGALWCRGHGGTQKQDKQRQNGRAGPDLGPMVGEISPDIMFCKKQKKSVRMARDGCVWVPMAAVGCGGTEGQENTGKRAPDGRVGHVLQCIVTNKRYRMSSRMVAVTGEDHHKC